jgi:hypothetical protein
MPFVGDIPLATAGPSGTLVGFDGSAVKRFRIPNTNLATVNVRDYGALGNGSVDDGPAFQSAINAALSGATPSPVYVPAGIYVVNTALTASDDLDVIGDGIRGTNLYTSSPNITLFTCAGRLSLCGMRIRDDASTTGTSKVARINGGLMPAIVDCFIDGFDVQFDFSVGWNIVVDRCFLVNAKTAELRIANVAVPDKGDHSVSNTTFANSKYPVSSEAAILWNSSGGLKINNCKFLAHKNQVEVSMGAGVDTVDLIIYGCSFEDADRSHIKFSNSGGFFRRTQIVANQFGAVAAPSAAFTSIDLGDSTNRSVLIEGNIFEGPASPAGSVAIKSSNAYEVQVWNNTFQGFETCITENFSTGAALNIASNEYKGITKVASLCSSPISTLRSKDVRLSSNVWLLTSNSSFECFSLNVASAGGYGSVVLDLKITGLVQGVGAFSLSKRVALVANVGTVTVTNVFSGASGPSVDVLINASNPANVLIGVNNVNSVQLDGLMEMSVIGLFLEVSRLVA